MKTSLYPFLFAPNLHETIWGGDRLCPFKGLTPHENPVGESWEVSAVPSSPDTISNGAEKGKDLISVISSDPEAILGKAVSKQYCGKMPLLVKFIDAKRDLSIQVHPNDEMAKRVHNKMGKTEMWYVLDAKPGSYLYCGFKTKISKEEYKQRIADGTITDVLARHEVKAGDVFYIPAGRVHAICSGIMLAEIQQSSDVTYRIYDYNRPGLDGKPRELHTELAAEALDFNVADSYSSEYKHEANTPNVILDTKYFCVRVSDLDKPHHYAMKGFDSFVVCMCLKGDCKIKVNETGDELVLKEGYSCLIPAAIADYDIMPVGEKTQVLDAFIDNNIK